MILAQLKSRQREHAMQFLFAFSQISLALVLVAQHLNLAWVPGWFPLDFVFGLLTGLSVVGNLASLAYFGKKYSNKREGSDDRKI